MRNLVLMFVMTFAVSACLGSDFADSIEGDWLLTTATADGAAVPMLESHPITLALGAGRISGIAACNTYSGEYELSGSSFTITDGLAVTEMACQPEEAMRSERAFLDAIAAVDNVALDNEGLVMRGPGVELRFEISTP